MNKLIVLFSTLTLVGGLVACGEKAKNHETTFPGQISQQSCMSAAIQATQYSYHSRTRKLRLELPQNYIEQISQIVRSQNIHAPDQFWRQVHPQYTRALRWEIQDIYNRLEPQDQLRSKSLIHYENMLAYGFIQIAHRNLQARQYQVVTPVQITTQQGLMTSGIVVQITAYQTYMRGTEIIPLCH